MADFLKKKFRNFDRANKRSIPAFNPRTEIHMSNPLITESETQRALKDLNPNKGAGPYGLFPKAHKTWSPYIAPILSHISNLSLQTPQIPDDCAVPSLP